MHESKATKNQCSLQKSSQGSSSNAPNVQEKKVIRHIKSYSTIFQLADGSWSIIEHRNRFFRAAWNTGRFIKKVSRNLNLFFFRNWTH